MKTKIIIMAQLSLSALFISAATTAALNDGRAASLVDEPSSELMQLVSEAPNKAVNHLHAPAMHVGKDSRSTDVADVRLRSNHVVDWLVTDSENRVYQVNGKSRFNKLLPAGHYNVSVSLRDFTLHKAIHVLAGQALTAELDLPLGKIRLIATKDNQPLFKPVAWGIYRLVNDERRPVGEYHLHSQSISIPAGHYEAVAKYGATISKRQFLVRRDSQNEVILALD